MKNKIIGFVLFCQIFAIAASAQTAFVRPLPPTAVNASFNSAGQVVVQFTPASGGVIDSFTDYRYQAVLVNDLSVSLQMAFQSGIGANCGSMISVDTICPANQIVLPVSKPSSYYLAVSSSGIRKNTPSKDRIQSGWKLYTQSDSLPVRIIAGTDSTLYAMAHYTGTDKRGAVAMITFALSSAAGKSFTLNNGSTSVLGITNLGAISTSGSLLVVDNIKTAIRSVNSSITNVIVKKDTLSHTFFTIFSHINNPSMTDGISYRVVDTSSSKVWAEGKVAVSPDGGLENILTTTSLLTRMTQVTGSDTLNPVNETPGASTSDSISVKLLSGILFHSVIAHNSPKSELAEEDNGIFTNYIQYFDNIVRNWSSVNDSAVGLARLRNIYYRVLTQNTGVITDPVWALNHGTLAEFGKAVQERKNYAFYEGYSRLYFDLEKPVYSTGVNSGAGIQFKISDNIELYKANLADTFNMFDTAIINGKTERRLIVNAKDSILDNVNNSGIWITGIIPDNLDDNGDLVWYSGVKALRLPLTNLRGSGFKVDTAFSFTSESKSFDDITGKIIGGGGSSIFKMYALEMESDSTEDTLHNNPDPGIFLHYQRRIVEIDSNYFGGYDSISFDITGFDSAGQKVFIESTDGRYCATIKDTSQATREIQTKIYLDNFLTYVGSKPILVSKLFADEAQNGNLRKNLLKGHPYEIKVVDESKLTLNKITELDDNGVVRISMSTDAGLYTSADCSNIWSSDFSIVRYTNNNITSYKQELVKTWKEYKNLLNGKTSLFIKSDKRGKEKIRIELSWPGIVTRKYTKNCGIPRQVMSKVVENLTIDFKYSGIVLEPITNERIPESEDGAGELYNPSCVVLGDYASFKIDVDNKQISPSQIKWHCKNQSVQFSEGGGVWSNEGTGFIVRVRGMEVKGEDKLILNINGYDGIPPEISFNVLAKKEVNVYTYIVKDDDGNASFTDSIIDDAFRDGNLILKQIGVHLNRVYGIEIHNDSYYELPDLATMKNLIDTKKNTTDGVEIYFVRGQMFDENMIAEAIFNKGIVITMDGYIEKEKNKNSFRNYILAHEVLHCMRDYVEQGQAVNDIYDFLYDMTNTLVEIPEERKIVQTDIPLDWGTGYYYSNTTLLSAIKKLLMFGHKATTNFDIPRGTVRGILQGPIEGDADCGGIVNLTNRIFQNEK